MLADRTRPAGHRKIAALFLFDPNHKITNTLYVPLQRENRRRAAGALKRGLRGFNLPRELQDKVLKAADFPLGMREAKVLG